jgi:hypothetical protein
MQHPPKRFRVFAFAEGAYGEEGFEFFSFSFFWGRKKRNQFCWVFSLLNDN